MKQTLLYLLFFIGTFSTAFSQSSLTNFSFTELDSMVMLHYYQGDFEGALPYLEQGLKKAETEFGKEHETFVQYVGELGFFSFKTGAYEKAEALYIQASEILKKTGGNNNMEYAYNQNNLAGLYRDMGRFDEAEQLYLEALAIEKNTYEEGDPALAEGLNNLAYLYNIMQRLDESEALYLEAHDLLKGLDNPESQYSYGLCINNLASLYQDMGRPQDAEPLLLEVKTIWKKLLGAMHPDYAMVLSGLGTLYEGMKKFNKAEVYFEESKAIVLQSLGPQHPIYLTTLYQSAKFNLSAKRFDAFWASAQQSLQLNSQIAISTHITAAWKDSLQTRSFISFRTMILTLEKMYHALRLEAKPDYQKKQLIVAELAMQLLNQNRASYTATEDKLRVLSFSNDWTLYSLQVLDKTTAIGEAFSFAEQSKSVLLMDAAKAERAYNFGDLPDSLVAQQKNLMKQQSELEAQLIATHSEAEKDDLRFMLNDLNLNIKSFKKTIEQKYPKYAALKYQNKDVQIEEVQELLPPNAAMLEYVVGDSSVYIFYIDQQTTKLLEIPLQKSELNQRIQKLHGVLSSYTLLQNKPKVSYEGFTRNAHWFYQKLIAPVLSIENKHINQLIIVTDDKLGYLPFETFLVEEAEQKQTDYKDMHFLVHDYEISYDYSATLWKENKQTTHEKSKANAAFKKGQMLAMAANYDIHLDSLQQGLRLPLFKHLRGMLQPLPQAKKEVDVLMQSFEGYFGFDQMASEQIFKQQAAHYTVIHLAMHGLLNPKSPILSSLAFTEDSQPVEDNFLHAYEISKMNLNAELVVLSACETGFGKFEKGNGIASLARAFMYAGAPSLVVSLWQVNDYATSVIMKLFYENLSKGLNKSAALQQAKLDYIKSVDGLLAHPAFWSPFIQMGDSKPIDLVMKGASKSLWPYILGGGVLLLLLGFGWKRSRKES